MAGVMDIDVDTPMDLPMLATVASTRKCCGTSAVVNSSACATLYTTLELNRYCLRSASNDEPSRVETASLPRRPRPSFSTQFTTAAAASPRSAPMPMAYSICCVASTLSMELATRWQQRQRA